MKKLTRVGCFLILLGSSAIAASAQTAEDLSSVSSDPRLIVNEPACELGPYCIEVTSTISTNVLSFSVPSPGGVSISPETSYTCSSNVFEYCTALENPAGTEFYGYVFYDGSVSDGEMLTIASDAPIVLDLPPGLTCDPASACSDGVIDLTPEPGTALLYLTGLVILVGSVRKRRFGENYIITQVH